jgi:tetratricopeptide (TPR) repeat protein
LGSSPVGGGKASEVGSSRVAGVYIGARRDLPDEKRVRDHIGIDLSRDSDLDGESPYVRYHGIGSGEILELRLDFERVPTDYHVWDREYAASQAGAAVLAVAARLKLPEEAGTTPTSQARYCGFELGDVAWITKSDGVLFSTSRENVYAGLERVGDSVHIEKLVQIRSPAWIERAGGISAAEIERLAASDPAALATRSRELLHAASLGSKFAARLEGRASATIDAELLARVEAQRAKLAERPTGLDVEAFAALAAEFAGVTAPDGMRPARAAAAFDAWSEELAAKFESCAANALAAKRPFEHGAWLVLAEVFAGVRAGSQLELPPGALDATFRSLALLDGATLTERVLAHAKTQAELEKDTSVATALLAGTLRRVLIDDLRAHALAAGDAGLHATAAAHYLLAHGVELGPQARTNASETLAQAEEAVIAEAGPSLAHARRHAALLAAELTPFFDASSTSSEPALLLFDEGRIFAGTALRDRLGLVTGDRYAQDAFGRDSSGKRYAFVAAEPEIRLSRNDRREMASASFSKSRQVANTSALTEWDRRMWALSDRIADLGGVVDRAITAANTVTGWHGFVSYRLDPSSPIDAPRYDAYKDTETLASIQARLEAVGDAERGQQELEALLTEYDALAASRPSDARTETTSWVVEYPRDLQVWSVHVEREASIVLGSERHTIHAEQQFDVEYARVTGFASQGIPNVDEWRDEAAVRADRALFDRSLPAYARLAWKDFFAKRLAERDASLTALAAGESAERAAKAIQDERFWQQWLFAVPSELDDPTLGAKLETLGALFDAACAGNGGRAPKALGDLVRIAVPDRDDASAVYEAAVACREAHDWNAAERYAERVTQLAPDNETAWKMLAVVNLDVEDWSDAIAAYRRLDRLAPNPGTRLWIGALHAAADDWPAAKEALEAEAAQVTREQIEWTLGQVRALRERRATAALAEAEAWLAARL